LFPMISHTAEEAWGHLPKWSKGQERGDEKPESVALADWVEVPKHWRNESLAEKWRQLLAIRDEVKRALEIAKNERSVVNPLEAKVTLLTDGSLAEFLNGFTVPLNEVFIVSQVEVRTDGKHSNAIPAEEFPNLHIAVELAPGEKCARCWQRQESVSKDSEYPDLCERCAKVVRKR
ncbi:MAG: class I tRNA ligase family protein, partial [Armatimonadetes bacterium]|nr:class I tRNA ligase family protein [Armatimonadota bacterium]